MRLYGSDRVCKNEDVLAVTVKLYDANGVATDFAPSVVLPSGK